jgi:hypothetical protein
VGGAGRSVDSSTHASTHLAESSASCDMHAIRTTMEERMKDVKWMTSTLKHDKRQDLVWSTRPCQAVTHTHPTGKIKTSLANASCGILPAGSTPSPSTASKNSSEVMRARVPDDVIA